MVSFFDFASRLALVFFGTYRVFLQNAHWKCPPTYWVLAVITCVLITCAAAFLLIYKRFITLVRQWKYPKSDIEHAECPLASDDRRTIRGESPYLLDFTIDLQIYRKMYPESTESDAHILGRFKIRHRLLILIMANLIVLLGAAIRGTHGQIDGATSFIAAIITMMIGSSMYTSMFHFSILDTRFEHSDKYDSPLLPHKLQE